MSTGTPVEAAAEELARRQSSQAEAFSAEVRLVGVPHVNGQTRQAVSTTPTRSGGTSLGESEEALESQRPLEDFWTHAHCVEAAPAQLAGRVREEGGEGVDWHRMPGHQSRHRCTHQWVQAERTSKRLY